MVAKRPAASLLGAAVFLAGAVALARCDRSPDDGGLPPAPAGVLRIGVVRPSTLDPAQARTVDEQLLADQLFDGLTGVDPESLEVVPALADRWSATADQRQWEFKLRDGASFADGRPITADDVVFTLERIAAKGSGSSVADLLEPITGYAAVALDGATTDLVGVSAPSSDVVRIELDQPMSTLPVALTNPAFGVVPRLAAEAGPPAPAFGEDPIGSGPFGLAERTTDSLSLERMARRGASTSVRAIAVRFFGDRGASYAAFVAGQLDWTLVPPDESNDAGARFGREHFVPYVAELFYAMNLAAPPLSDRRVREAIVKAIDREAIVRDVYKGTVAVANGLLVDALPGVQPDVCGELCNYDPARARALLGEAAAAAGGSLGEVPIDYDDDPTQTAVAESIQAALAAVGLPASLRPHPSAEYEQAAVSPERRLFRLGWVAAYPSPDAVLTPLFLGGSANNLVGLANPVVDDALRAARAEPDPAVRTAHFRTAEAAIAGEVAVVPMAQFRLHSVATSRVRGLRLTPLGSFDASTVRLG